MPPHPTHPPLGGGGGGEVAGRVSGVGKWWGKDHNHEDHAKNTRRALTHMVAKGQATSARSFEGANMRKDVALSLVTELGESVVTKVAEYGIDLEEFGPLLNGYVAYHKLGLNGVNHLMDQAIKMVKDDALIHLSKMKDISKFTEIPE